MDIIKALISISMLILEIILIVKLFISFKQIKELTIENRNLRNQVTNLSNNQKTAFLNQEKTLEQILNKLS